MGSKSQRKGATAEREFSRLLHEHTGIASRRRLESRWEGGHDLQPEEGSELDAFAFEVKRYRSVSDRLIAEWWKQTVRQAVTVKKIPCLAYRADRQQWRVVLPAPDTTDLSQTKTLYLEGFLSQVNRERLEAMEKVQRGIVAYRAKKGLLPPVTDGGRK